MMADPRETTCMQIRPHFLNYIPHEGTVYNDSATGTLYVHNQPTDPRCR